MLTVEKRALLLLDFQRAVCGQGGALGVESGATAHSAQRQLQERLVDCLLRARRTNDLIVHIGVRFGRDYPLRTNRSERFASLEANKLMLEGTEGVQFLAGVTPLPHELVMWKSSVCPFATTPLASILRAHGIRHLLLAGVSTNAVVESTARYAGDRGYRVAVLEDLCASYNEDAHSFAISVTLPLFAEITSSSQAYPVA